MWKNPVISIIVPVYNVETYIEKCLQSICRQSYNNIEIIVVDDCSTDKSVAVCERYAAKDNRIRVLHSEKNQGVSAARNRGMEYANGDYYMFVDSDDWIEPELCENAVRCMQENQRVDTVHWGYKCVAENGNVESEVTPTLYPQRTIEQPEIFNKFIDTLVVSLNDLYEWFYSSQSYFEAIHSKKQMGAVWRYLFSATIIKDKHLQFPIGVDRGEDLVFLICYLQECRAIVNMEMIPYNYLQRKDSLFKDDTNVTQKIKHMEALEKTVQCVPAERREELRDKWRGQRILVVMNTARRLVKVKGFKQGYAEFKQIAVHQISRDAYHKIKLKGIPWKYKIAIGLIKYRMYLVFYLCIYFMHKLNVDLAPMD